MKNPFRVFKKLNPIRPIKKGIGMLADKVYVQIALLIVRHALTAFGAAGALSSDELTQLAGTVSAAVGLLWSAWRKIQRARSGEDGAA